MAFNGLAAKHCGPKRAAASVSVAALPSWFTALMACVPVEAVPMWDLPTDLTEAQFSKHIIEKPKVVFTEASTEALVSLCCVTHA